MLFSGPRSRAQNSTLWCFGLGFWVSCFCFGPPTAWIATFSTRWTVFDTLPSPPPNPGFYACISVSKPVSKSKYQYLSYSMSFDTLTAEPLCPTSPIAAPGPTGQGVYVADRGYAPFCIWVSENNPS